jgi:hypothetical protein
MFIVCGGVKTIQAVCRLGEMALAAIGCLHHDGVLLLAVLPHMEVFLGVGQGDDVGDPSWVVAHLPPVTWEASDEISHCPSGVASHAPIGDSHIPEQGLVVENVDRRLIIKEYP